MKKLLYLLLLVPAVSFANGPLFRHKDTYANQEFENVYQDIRGLTSKASRTTSVNVLDYGADNTGTTDSSTAFYAAIAAATSTVPGKQGYGAVVYAPAGIYKLAVNVGTAIVSFQGDPFATYFIQKDTTSFILNFTNGTIDRRYIRNIYFFGASHTGRGVYVNGLSYIYIENCQFQSLEVGLYTNGSEWNHIYNTDFNSNTLGWVATTKNGDILGNNPQFNQNSAASVCITCGFNSNHIGFYTDDPDNGVGDHQAAFLFVRPQVLSNDVGIAAVAPSANNNLYNPLVIDSPWLEQNLSVGTTVYNGNTLTYGGLSVSGYPVVLKGGSLNDRINLSNQAKFYGQNLSLTGLTDFSVSVTTDVVGSMSDILVDKQNGMVIDWAFVDNLQSYNPDRPALARSKHRAGFTYASNYRNVVTAGSSTGAFGTIPTTSSGSIRSSFVYGDGFYNNTCMRFTGTATSSVRWTALLSSASWYVTTFAVRSDTFTTTIASFTFNDNTNVIVPTQRGISLSPQWRTYASIGQPSGSGSTTIDLALQTATTIYVSCFQIVGFPTLQEAKDFYNSDTFVLLPSEITQSNGNSGQIWTSNGNAASPTFQNLTSTLASGSTNYIQNTSSLQSGATFFVSSGTVSGPLKVTGQFIGNGTTAGDNASSGQIGEYISTQSATSASISATGTYQNYLAISLSSGDWDVTGNLVFDPGTGANLANFLVAISTFSGNTTSDHITGLNVLNYNASIPTGLLPRVIPRYRISTASAVTAYLKGRVSFTSGTPNFDDGSISARRVR